MAETRYFRLRDYAAVVSILLSVLTIGSISVGAGVVMGRIQAGVVASDKIANDLRSYIEKAVDITERNYSEVVNLKIGLAEHCATAKELERRVDSCCPRGGK